jgi:hypothetical protein
MKKLMMMAMLAVSSMLAEEKLGEALKLSDQIAIDALLQSPDKHVGKVVQVKGKITAVCQMMGCWMNLVDTASGKSIRIKVNDGEIEFPKKSAGRMAIAEGRLQKIELTREKAIAQAKHEAEEMGRKFDPASVKGPQSWYQIQGMGAVILD